MWALEEATPLSDGPPGRSRGGTSVFRPRTATTRPGSARPTRRAVDRSALGIPDGLLMADNPYLVAPGAGLEVVLHDLRIVHKVEGVQVAGALSIVEHAFSRGCS